MYYYVNSFAQRGWDELDKIVYLYFCSNSYETSTSVNIYFVIACAFNPSFCSQISAVYPIRRNVELHPQILNIFVALNIRGYANRFEI